MASQHSNRYRPLFHYGEIGQGEVLTLLKMLRVWMLRGFRSVFKEKQRFFDCLPFVYLSEGL
jgi:hypothetical protein